MIHKEMKSWLETLHPPILHEAQVDQLLTAKEVAIPKQHKAFRLRVCTVGGKCHHLGPVNFCPGFPRAAQSVAVVKD